MVCNCFRDLMVCNCFCDFMVCNCLCNHVESTSSSDDCLCLCARCRALMFGKEMTAECRILRPVSFTLTVVRNISASWHHEHPDIDVSMNLDNFNVRASVCV